MSELHLEITELAEAGVNIFNTDETYRYAKVHGYRLVAGVIEHDRAGYLGFVNAWFNTRCAE
ncbi:cell division protein [Actinotignum sp. GS-2025e]|uniref:cell division protein n=1 Tax=Actinotignum sp. GS-2025e TaxID=3427278 RepID=UPI003F460F33